MKFINWTLIVCCWLVACRDPAVTSVNTRPKLVVTCFISPQDTLLRASVSRSMPLGSLILKDSLRAFVAACQVSLSDGGARLLLQYDAKNNMFFAKPTFSILAGHTYFLDVVAPSGERVSARCTVPAPNRSLAVVLDSVGEGYAKKFYARYTWKDMAGTKNFYRVSGYLQDESETHPFSWKTREADGDLLTDEGNDGNMMASPVADLQTYKAKDSQVSLSLLQPNTVLHALLLTVDENYYYFHRTMALATGSSSLAEPIGVYSNITGGHGAFGAFNRVKILTNVR